VTDGGNLLWGVDWVRLGINSFFGSMMLLIVIGGGGRRGGRVVIQSGLGLQIVLQQSMMES